MSTSMRAMVTVCAYACMSVCASRPASRQLWIGCTAVHVQTCTGYGSVYYGIEPTWFACSLQDLPVPARLLAGGGAMLADIVQANALTPEPQEDEDTYWARATATATATPTTSGSSNISSSSSNTEVAGPRNFPMGLWPEASLLNHSCQPNTISYVLG